MGLGVQAERRLVQFIASAGLIGAEASQVCSKETHIVPTRRKNRLIRNEPCNAQRATMRTAGTAAWCLCVTFAAAAPAWATDAPAAKTHDPQIQSTAMPAGANIAALDFGGDIVSITGTFGPGHTGRSLIDATTGSTWQPEGKEFAFPQDIVISFYAQDTALVSAVTVTLPPERAHGPKEVEVWAAKDDSTAAFSKVAAATLTATKPAQVISFAPVEARYVKLRVLSSGEKGVLEIGKIQVTEGSRLSYTALRARHPEITGWKYSARFAAQRGIEWLQPAAVEWQRNNQCFGCHVQAQAAMGLAVATRNGYLVSRPAVQELTDYMRILQDADGMESGMLLVDNQSVMIAQPAGKGSHTPADQPIMATLFAAMSFAYLDQMADTKRDPTLLKFADWLAAKQQPTGEVLPDLDEAPICQGSFMTTANAALAFMQAFVESGDSRYQAAGVKAIDFIAAAKPVTTQDEAFSILALSHFGNPQQQALVNGLIAHLKAEQGSNGGWSESRGSPGPNAFATGQVLYAFKESGVDTRSAEFVRGVKYLLHTQEDTGAWPVQNSATGRPSEFAPTMWAVIGLAGSYGQVEDPTAESLKSQLDQTGRAVLYINFDFNKSTLRPDAKPIIAQVVKLMTDDPSLNLAINGHTDNVGQHDYNAKLSQTRAAAVVSALVAAQIAPDRLSSGGFGPDQPIDDNDTDKGRAKNRRVELVKK
jgi:outer membrane protein OmpA-like peptidoglycan-associated protein